MGKKSSDNVDSNITITEHQLGAWKFKLADSSSFDPVKSWNEFVSAFPLLRRLVLDIFGVAPGLFTLYIICQIWEGVEESVMMHLSNRLLQMIEIGLISGHFDSWNISVAIGTRLFCTLAVTYLNAYGIRVLDLLDGSVTRHFQLMIIQAELRMDLSTTQKTGGLPTATANEAWKALETILSFVKVAFMAMSQLFLIIHLSRSSGGWLYGLLCLSRPICGVFFSKSFYHYVTFAFVNNIDHRRMAALNKFSGKEYKQDIISGNMGQWIISEMKKTHKRLGLVSSRHPVHLYETSPSMTLSHACMAVIGDLPMVYCAINALSNPGKTSIASLAILQQSTLSLRTTGALFSLSTNSVRGSIASLKAVYTATELLPTSVANGNTPYPPSRHESKLDSSKGMSLELRNVAFSYPGEQKTTPALKGVSLTISAGQLVVIVGANGSGKSTLVRILSRLYEPASGDLIIDGVSAKSYRIEDLHEATALLSQDNKLYPFTVAENIGLGFPEHIEDEVMILDACRKGGSLKIIQNFKDGLQTTLDPCIDSFQFNLHDKPNHPLYQEMENIQKQIEVSGGEKQKIVASRTFLRFNSGKVKFVAVDEPSSALDAEAELELFNNLRAEQPGKTMVIVTHRFGHLTRYADQIICMKEGAIVERGTHAQLMEQRGEYANLYTIQAEAFS